MPIVEIYALCDPDDGAVRYVGKAKNAATRYRQHLSQARNGRTPVYRWLRSLSRAPVLVTLECCDEAVWADRERHHIALHRRAGRLLNIADGGDQPQRSEDELSQKIWRFKRYMRQHLRFCEKHGLGVMRARAIAKMQFMAQRLPERFAEWRSAA